MARYVVLGAGVSGLTTAICLAESGHGVEVWSPLPPERTTSAVASALWGPSFQQPLGRTLAWTKTSLAMFTRLAENPETGVRIARVVTAGDQMPAGDPPPQVELIPQLRSCAPDEVPAGFAGASSASMPVIDMPVYLAYLSQRLHRAAGRLLTRAATSLPDAGTGADAVVNCTGLGAWELAGDESIRPVFGQHVEVTNPGIEDVFMELTDRGSWVAWYPHPDRVVLGGVSIPDRWDPAPLPGVTTQILERCREHEPRLRESEVITVRAGLRPDRSAVRVEHERVEGVPVIHNYGHGGSGVSLSWGCAREAAEMAVQIT